jgi:hypothetical protein
MSDPGPRQFTELLGPARPELSCEECFEHLDRYVELELADRDADIAIPGMQAHLQGCPACAGPRQPARLRRIRARPLPALTHATPRSLRPPVNQPAAASGRAACAGE